MSCFYKQYRLFTRPLHFRAYDRNKSYQQNTKWGEISFSIELRVIWEAGLMENQIHVYKTQSVGLTWTSCYCILITLVTRWANIVMTIVLRWQNMEPICWSNVRPMSKITLGQHRRKAFARYKER